MKNITALILTIIFSLVTSIVFAQTIQLAKTGQTVSYRTGDDGGYGNGASGSNRFTDNGDLTITDNLTGLMWSKNANATGVMSWYDAIDYTNSLYLGGESCEVECGAINPLCIGDWRLPNIRELSSLIDYSTVNPALPLNHPFINVRLSGETIRYWTSTTTMPSNGYTGFAWSLEFGAGTTSQHNDKVLLRYVWAVRSDNKYPGPDYCSEYGPCKAGIGDCDKDSECAIGLYCAQDVGANYGWPSNVDVCEQVSCGGL
jgi:hypothetical protein